MDLRSRLGGIRKRLARSRRVFSALGCVAALACEQVRADELIPVLGAAARRAGPAISYHDLKTGGTGLILGNAVRNSMGTLRFSVDIQGVALSGVAKSPVGGALSAAEILAVDNGNGHWPPAEAAYAEQLHSREELLATVAAHPERFSPDIFSRFTEDPAHLAGSDLAPGAVLGSGIAVPKTIVLPGDLLSASDSPLPRHVALPSSDVVIPEGVDLSPPRLITRITRPVIAPFTHRRVAVVVKAITTIATSDEGSRLVGNVMQAAIGTPSHGISYSLRLYKDLPPGLYAHCLQCAYRGCCLARQGATLLSDWIKNRVRRSLLRRVHPNVAR